MIRTQFKYLNKSLFIVLLISFSNIEISHAQKQVTNFNQAWTGYFNQTRLSNKWGYWADVHVRTHENFFDNISQTIVRIGGTYYLNNDTKLTAGYAYINNYAPANHANITTPEHRPWQQIQWHTKYPKLRLMQWLRIEERFRQKLKNVNELDNSFAFNFRIRYNFLMQIPLSEKKFQPKTFSFIANNELHINLGKEIILNTFDQNRFFIGLAYQTNKTDNLQFGYMNLFQQQAAGNIYRSLHTARIFYFHNLDLRKSK